MDATDNAEPNPSRPPALTLSADDYPDLLRRVPDRPPTLHVAGDVDTLYLPALAIVGSRNPTSGGTDTAYRFAEHLARSGFCIVSGLAQGIDAAAHRGALAGGGKTVAVLGHGLDQVYPPQNAALADEIVRSGALITEYAEGTPPRRAHFPQRNRLIAGLSLGTLVVEAAVRSGSLITARLAGELGREVFAIPGSIHNPLARGCHRLLRQGARLVETADDILSELAPLLEHLMQNAAPTTDITERKQYDGDYLKLLDALGYDPQTPDELAKKSGLTIDEVSSMLLILELDGAIDALPGGRFSRLAS